MPLTHDIGVRIPYPLLKTDNFGCLFFLFIRLLYAELAGLLVKIAHKTKKDNLSIILIGGA